LGAAKYPHRSSFDGDHDLTVSILVEFPVSEKLKSICE
jgi:hypothetical protein